MTNTRDKELRGNNEKVGSRKKTSKESQFPYRNRRYETLKKNKAPKKKEKHSEQKKVLLKMKVKMAEMNMEIELKDQETGNGTDQSTSRPNLRITGGLKRENRHFTRTFLRTERHELLN